MEGRLFWKMTSEPAYGVPINLEDMFNRRRNPALRIGQARISGKNLLGKFGVRKPAYNFEGAIPPGSSEKMLHQINGVRQDRIGRRAREILRGRSIGPIDKNRFANNVVSRYEAPISTV